MYTLWKVKLDGTRIQKENKRSYNKLINDLFEFSKLQ